MKIVNVQGKKYIEDISKRVTSVNVEVPDVFDIFHNLDESLEFFSNIVTISECENFRGELIFDFKNVQVLSIDAIMYTIALSNKICKENKNITCGIIKPKRSKCKKLFLKCGIGFFLKHDGEFKEDYNDYFSITFGYTVDVDKARLMSDFCHDKLGFDNNELKFIYKMFIELMNNTVQHAYINDISYSKPWFAFIENTKSKLKFTFLDTGVGIPLTVQKHENWDEFNTQNDLKNLIEGNDSRFIFSAMCGDVKRSATGDPYRGRGLPEIYGYYKDDKHTSKLKIVSGKGVCQFYDSKRDVPILRDSNKNFQGTLFYWEIDKINIKKNI